MDAAEVRFFDGKPEALALYAALMERVRARLPGVETVVYKTQITMKNRHGFAFVSLPRPGMKGRAPGRIVVSFGLPARVDDPRILASVEPYPNRWTHHVCVFATDEIDETLLGWIAAAAAFSQQK